MKKYVFVAVLSVSSLISCLSYANATLLAKQGSNTATTTTNPSQTITVVMPKQEVKVSNSAIQIPQGTPLTIVSGQTTEKIATTSDSSISYTPKSQPLLGWSSNDL